MPGDWLDQAVTLEEGTNAGVVSAGAKRFYRGLPGETPDYVRTAITLGAAAALEWLPQESILFDATALDRTLAVEMEEDAWLLGLEALFDIHMDDGTNLPRIVRHLGNRHLSVEIVGAHVRIT